MKLTSTNQPNSRNVFSWFLLSAYSDASGITDGSLHLLQYNPAANQQGNEKVVAAIDSQRCWLMHLLFYVCVMGEGILYIVLDMSLFRQTDYDSPFITVIF